ncbi:MAG: hypothetical protein CM15mP45_10790 [Deltaproteobacteria bacterium]|nr:MAG: hypothetical protein CM15mP45_10790 [Deltaproteobacteria bacterium]
MIGKKNDYKLAPLVPPQKIGGDFCLGRIKSQIVDFFFFKNKNLKKISNSGGLKFLGSVLEIKRNPFCFNCQS